MVNNIVTSRHIVNGNIKSDSKPLPYKMHDLNSVYTHYDKTKGYNVSTENKLDDGGVINNGKSSK